MVDKAVYETSNYQTIPCSIPMCSIRRDIDDDIISNNQNLITKMIFKGIKILCICVALVGLKLTASDPLPRVVTQPFPTDNEIAIARRITATNSPPPIMDRDLDPNITQSVQRIVNMGIEDEIKKSLSWRER